MLRDTVSQDVPFPSEEDFEAKVNRNRDSEQQPYEDDVDRDGKLQKWPHPRSDFSHIDPTEFSDAHLAKAKEKLGETSEEFTKLKDLVGSGARGMQRLGLVFERTLWKAHDILGTINESLRTNNPVKYRQARKEYIALVQDLDNHEPQMKKNHVKPGQSGYGSCVKWASIEPVIKEGKIKGACVVLLWNPHSTSSGIPIPHK